jgi:hypothetical protein
MIGISLASNIVSVGYVGQGISSDDFSTVARIFVLRAQDILTLH